MNDQVHIIAEAGTTHEGDVAVALQLVATAKAAGADSVKFQFIEPSELYLEHLRQDGGLVENPAIAARTAQMLSREEWRRVADTAKAAGIEFSASVFGPGTLEQLIALAPPYIKLASTDTTNLPLIEMAANTGKTVLLSTGMSTLGEIEKAVGAIRRAGVGDVVLLHCVSSYPCPADIANVGFIPTLKQAFGLPVGYSDHTETSVSAIAAVALGATWIEKHMTLDRNAKGFDHAYAMEPDMLTQFIADIRAVEAALAVQVPKVGGAEASVRERARRGLWAREDLPAGHVLRHEDILAVRPAGPLTPGDIDRVVGKVLNRPLSKSEAVDWSVLAP